VLSLILLYFNFLYMLFYLGGISSGNIVISALLGLSTAVIIILNKVLA